jgi:hypothetical protein
MVERQKGPFEQQREDTPDVSHCISFQIIKSLTKTTY